jgi:hypothetical protein
MQTIIKSTFSSIAYVLFLGWLKPSQEQVVNSSIADKKEETKEEWNYLLQLTSL